MLIESWEWWGVVKQCYKLCESNSQWQSNLIKNSSPSIDAIALISMIGEFPSIKIKSKKFPFNPGEGKFSMIKIPRLITIDLSQIFSWRMSIDWKKSQQQPIIRFYHNLYVSKATRIWIRLPGTHCRVIDLIIEWKKVVKMNSSEDGRSPRNEVKNDGEIVTRWNFDVRDTMVRKMVCNFTISLT